MDAASLNPATIRNIVLDFGGVLYDIDYTAPARAFAKLGWSSFEDDYAKGAQSELFDGLETGSITEGEFLKVLGARCAPGTLPSEVLSAWNSILIGLPERSLKTLDVLSLKYKLYIFSNTNAIHAPVFERQIAEIYGRGVFPDYFQDIVYSHRFGMRKPDPEAYKAYAEQFHLAPGATLFVDDSMPNVEGARRAGWHALHLDVKRDHLQELLTRNGLI